MSSRTDAGFLIQQADVVRGCRKDNHRAEKSSDCICSTSGLILERLSTTSSEVPIGERGLEVVTLGWPNILVYTQRTSTTAAGGQGVTLHLLIILMTRPRLVEDPPLGGWTITGVASCTILCRTDASTHQNDSGSKELRSGKVIVVNITSVNAEPISH